MIIDSTISAIEQKIEQKLACNKTHEWKIEWKIMNIEDYSHSFSPFYSNPHSYSLGGVISDVSWFINGVHYNGVIPSATITTNNSPYYTDH